MEEKTLKKPLNIVVTLFPWVGMIIFGFLYAQPLTQGVGYNYLEDSYRDMETQNIQLTDYIKSRREYENDKLAFEGLGLILTKDFGGKYDSWINTQLGFIRFDSNGFIVAYCSIGVGRNSTECPPNL